MGIFLIEDFLSSVLQSVSKLDSCREVSYAKGSEIFHQGEVCSDVFIMTEGLVKLTYVTHEGKEWIKSFIMDKGVFGSRASQSLGQPSTFSVTCLENCRAMILPYKTFETMCVEDLDLAGMTFQFFQWLGLKKELREYDFLCLSAEEQYRKFLDENATLAGRITQTDMARYLGITPIALSRIKSRQKKFNAQTA
jgi:CRP-like cAMP-binding protein